MVTLKRPLFHYFPSVLIVTCNVADNWQAIKLFLEFVWCECSQQWDMTLLFLVTIGAILYIQCMYVHSAWFTIGVLSDSVSLKTYNYVSLKFCLFPVVIVFAIDKKTVGQKSSFSANAHVCTVLYHVCFKDRPFRWTQIIATDVWSENRVSNPISNR